MDQPHSKPTAQIYRFGTIGFLMFIMTRAFQYRIDRINLAINLWHRAIFFGALPAIDFFYSHISRSFDVDRKKGKEANGQSSTRRAGPGLLYLFDNSVRTNAKHSTTLYCTVIPFRPNLKLQKVMDPDQKQQSSVTNEEQQTVCLQGQEGNDGLCSSDNKVRNEIRNTNVRMKMQFAVRTRAIPSHVRSSRYATVALRSC